MILFVSYAPLPDATIEWPLFHPPPQVEEEKAQDKDSSASGSDYSDSLSSAITDTSEDERIKKSWGGGVK